MKKKGRPSRGYANARNLTVAESAACGLNRNVLVMTADTGNLTFWMRGVRGEGLDQVSAYVQKGERDKLEQFWDKG